MLESQREIMIYFNPNLTYVSAIKKKSRIWIKCILYRRLVHIPCSTMFMNGWEDKSIKEKLSTQLHISLSVSEIFFFVMNPNFRIGGPNKRLGWHGSR